MFVNEYTTSVIKIHVLHVEFDLYFSIITCHFGNRISISDFKTQILFFAIYFFHDVRLCIFCINIKLTVCITNFDYHQLISSS